MPISSTHASKLAQIKECEKEFKLILKSNNKVLVNPKYIQLKALRDELREIIKAAA